MQVDELGYAALAGSLGYLMIGLGYMKGALDYPLLPGVAFGLAAVALMWIVAGSKTTRVAYVFAAFYATYAALVACSMTIPGFSNALWLMYYARILVEPPSFIIAYKYMRAPIAPLLLAAALLVATLPLQVTGFMGLVRYAMHGFSGIAAAVGFSVAATRLRGYQSIWPRAGPEPTRPTRAQ